MQHATGEEHIIETDESRPVCKHVTFVHIKTEPSEKINCPTEDSTHLRGKWSHFVFKVFSGNR